MKLAMLTILVIATFARSLFGAFCTYRRSLNCVTCGQVTCQTASPARSADKTPAGYYYIGNYYTHPNMVLAGSISTLRDKQEDSGDYYTYVPDLNCKGYFGLHEGAKSKGCVTVTDRSCFNCLRRQITENFQVIPFRVHRCWFICSLCWNITVEHQCTADLQVY